MLYRAQMDRYSHYKVQPISWKTIPVLPGFSLSLAKHIFQIACVVEDRLAITSPAYPAAPPVLLRRLLRSRNAARSRYPYCGCRPACRRRSAFLREASRCDLPPSGRLCMSWVTTTLVTFIARGMQLQNQLVDHIRADGIEAGGRLIVDDHARLEPRSCLRARRRDAACGWPPESSPGILFCRRRAGRPCRSFCSTIS